MIWLMFVNSVVFCCNAFIDMFICINILKTGWLFSFIL